MEIVVRSTAVFFLLLLVTRGLGKRELAQMSAFELVLLICIGDIVQQAITQEDMSVTGAALAMGTFAFWVLVLAVVSFRFRRTRPLIDGVPIVILRDGELLEEALRLERVPEDEVVEAARQQGISDLSHVRIGVLEPQGSISFLRYGDG